MSRSRILLRVDYIHHLKLSFRMIELINLDVVKAQVSCQQILVVPCHLYTVNMGKERSVGNGTDTLVINLISDTEDPAFIIKLKHCYLAIMISCHKEVLIFVIR